MLSIHQVSGREPEGFTAPLTTSPTAYRPVWPTEPTHMAASMASSSSNRKPVEMGLAELMMTVMERMTPSSFSPARPSSIPISSSFRVR